MLPYVLIIGAVVQVYQVFFKLLGVWLLDFWWPFASAPMQWILFALL